MTVATAILAGWSAAASGQPPAQPPTPTAAEPEQAPADTVRPPGVSEVYVYDPAGRRDPFLSLLNRGADLPSQSERPTGLAGLTVNDVALRGIVFSEDAYIAVLQAPDNKTYIVRDGDRLFDGSIQSITAEAVIFMQEVNDPLSLVEEREVRKPLRGVEEGR